MSASKFSSPFMEKNPLSPLKGNAFIKAKMDAEAAGKKTFTIDGRNYPVKMNTPLDLTAKQAKNLPPELVAEIKKKEGSAVKMENPKKKVKDTIRVSKKYKPGDYVEEFELEDAIKKQTGKFPQLSVQDYSTVKKDKKGNYVTHLKMKADSPAEMHESDEYRETYNKWLN